MNTKQLLNSHLLYLCNTIGARPTGSINNQLATNYIVSTLSEYGLDITSQEFDCINWQNNGTMLTCNGHTIEAYSSDYSLPCDITAPIICAHTPRQLQRIDCTGKILLIHDHLCKEPLMPKNFTFWNPEEHQEIIALLEKKNPLAILTASTFPIIEDGDFNIPCAIVSPDAIPHLKDDTFVQLCINTMRMPAKASNIIATYGTGKKIALCAHIDTKPQTKGALDNASGISVLLALAKMLPHLNLHHQVELVFFNGEDYYSNPGEVTYMNTYLTTSDDYLLAINIDGVSLKGSDTCYSFYECPNMIEEKTHAIASAWADFEAIAPWPQGDHMLFAMNQIPSIAITSSNIFDIIETVIHTPKDDLDQIELDKLEHIVHFLSDLISHAL